MGNAAAPRTLSDGSSSIGEIKIERISSMSFKSAGSVMEWKLYSNSAANISMMVVRPVAGSDLNFTIVGKNDIKTPNRKAAVIPVATADRIHVKAGDFIAWYYWPAFNPPIP